eukprot:jgi/Tetstr1/444361/TSEL_032252.t1
MLTAFLQVANQQDVTVYIHVSAVHLGQMIRRHGSMGKWCSQGLEALHQWVHFFGRHRCNKQKEHAAKTITQAIHMRALSARTRVITKKGAAMRARAQVKKAAKQAASGVQPTKFTKEHKSKLRVPPPDEAGPSTSRAATFGLPDVAAVNPIHRDPAKGKGPANPLPSNPQVEKGKAKMLSPIPEELHSAFPPKTEEEVENDWLTERANNKVHLRKIEHQKYVQLAIQEWQDAGEHRGYLEDYMVTANVGKQLAEEAEAEYSRLVNRGARLMQKRLHPSWAVEDSAEPSVQEPAEGVAGPGHEDRSPEPRASQSTVTNSSARGVSVSQDSLYDATQPEYHPSSDGGVSEEDEPAPPMAPASPAIELLDSPTPQPGRPPLQVDPRLRRGWDPNYENFDDWFSVWPDPESLYGEDYADLHYAMCKWLRDWEFDKFDIEYQYAFLEGFLRLCPPPPGVEFRFCHLRRFALVWMPWFMVTGLGLTPFEGPVRRGKMSFLRCLIDGVPWDVFPPGVGMSWWSAEQISRSLDLARTKFTASQDPTTRQGLSLI